jgi:hypothetical protein
MQSIHVRCYFHRSFAWVTEQLRFAPCHVPTPHFSCHVRWHTTWFSPHHVPAQGYLLCHFMHVKYSRAPSHRLCPLPMPFSLHMTWNPATGPSRPYLPKRQTVIASVAAGVCRCRLSAYSRLLLFQKWPTFPTLPMPSVSSPTQPLHELNGEISASLNWMPPSHANDASRHSNLPYYSSNGRRPCRLPFPPFPLLRIRHKKAMDSPLNHHHRRLLSFPQMPTSHHPIHIKWDDRPGLSQTQFFPAPLALLHRSMTASTSNSNRLSSLISVGLHMPLLCSAQILCSWAPPMYSSPSPCPHGEIPWQIHRVQFVGEVGTCVSKEWRAWSMEWRASNEERGRMVHGMKSVVLPNLVRGGPSHLGLW